MERKLKREYILLFGVIFVITICYSLFFVNSTSDEIWSYGFCSNVALGLVPYRDFNMIITPLFALVGSLFIKIFGEYLLVIHIFGALYIALIMVFIFRRLKWKALICYVYILIYYYPTYNTFLLVFIFTILWLVWEKRDRDIFIGVLVGLCFLTKQTVGLMLLIPGIYYAKNRVKVMAVFLVPIILCSIYLIYNGAFWQFIDYCFLGMFSFGEKNFLGSFLILEVLIILYLVIRLKKSNCQDKECFYVLMFQIISLPICDSVHFFYALSPVVYYFLSREGNYKRILYVATFGIVYLIGGVNIGNSIVDDRDNFMYLRNADLDLLEMEEQVKVIEKYEEQFDYVFYILDEAYFLKLYRGVLINKFDLLNNGNFGYDGVNRYISEIDDLCSANSCGFLVAYWYYDGVKGQLSKEIFNYVINDYELLNKEKYFHVYGNELE